MQSLCPYNTCTNSKTINCKKIDSYTYFLTTSSLTVKMLNRILLLNSEVMFNIQTHFYYLLFNILFLQLSCIAASVSYTSQIITVVFPCNIVNNRTTDMHC